MCLLVSTATENPDGCGLYTVKNNLRDQSHQIDLSVIRLEKLGYIEKRNESDINGNEYYLYIITSEGIELLLEKEGDAFPSQKEDVQPEFDDNIPF